MAGNLTRINNNQVTDASTGNTIVGINAGTKIQNYSITAGKIANNLTYGSDLTITGNLTVQGTTTNVDTVNTLIADPLITLADGQVTGTPTVDIGFLGLRGSQQTAVMAWQESAKEFVTALSSTTVSNTTFTLSTYANLHSGNTTIQGTTSLVGNIIGAVNATATVTAGNLATPGTASAAGNVTGGNLNTAGQVSATSNITGGNVLTGGLVSATGNGTFGNISTAGSFSAASLSASGNITGGNLLTGGLISAGGNVTGANLFGTNVSVTGTATAASTVGGVITGSSTSVTGSQTAASTVGGVITGSSTSVTGSQTAASTVGGVITGSSVSVTGTATAASTVGGVITGTSTSVTGSQTAASTVGGVITGTSTSVTGSQTAASTVGGVITGTSSSVTGNVDGGNINTGGQVSATATVTGGNLATGGTVSATANITGGNLLTGGAVSATATITGGNLATGGTASATGTITGGNLATGGTVSATGNAVLGNISTSGRVSATGSVIAGNISTAGNVSATGNVTGGNVITDYIYSTGNTTLTINAQTISLNPTGNVGMNGRWINNLADPVSDQDAATKVYVDTVAQGLDPKNSVLAATGNTLANLSGGVITYNNGTGGVGATLTTTGTYTTIDGVNIATVGARVLVKNEVTQANNGIYVYTSPTVLTRATDFNQPSEIPAAFTFVEDGTVYADTGWVCTTNAPVVIGTTAIVFVQFSGAGQYSGGNAISLTGTVINALYDTSANATISINGSNQLYIPAGAVLTTPNIGAATGTSVSVTGTVTAATVNSTTVSASGNVTGGNVNTAGQVSATANVVGGNVTTGGLISATATITGGNLATGGTASAGGNITGANLLTGGLVSATATITGGNLATGGTVSATGNATLGNVLTGGQVSATGNGTFGNISTGGSFSATTISVSGNITGGNLLTGGLISAGGNVTGANLFGTNVSVTGTQTAASTVGGVITGSSTSVTGTQTAASTVGGVITGSSTSVTGTQTAASTVGGVITGSSSSVTGTQTAASTVGGVITGSSSSVTGTQTAASTVGGVITGSSSSVTGNVDGGNINTGGQVSATATITGGNLATGGTVSATGNATAGNVLTDGVVSATGGVTGGNIVIAGNTVNMLNPGGTIQVNSGNANTNFSVNGTAANVFFVNATTNSASFGSSTQTTNAIVAFNTTSSILIPAGTQIQRPGTGVTGMMRFNSTTNSLEIYNNSAWIGVGSTVFTVITDQQFSGDGATTAFTLSNTATTASTIVSINGITQIPVSAYAVSGTTLTFTEAPATGDLIDVRVLTTTTTLLSLQNISANAGVSLSDTTNIVTITGIANVVGDLNVTGNATILGNVATNQINNGNSAVQIPTPNGNVTIDVGNVNDMGIFTTTSFNLLGNILPQANITYNLGSATQRWKDLYLSNSTIYLGNAQISANATAIVLTNPAGGQTVLAGATTTSSVAGNITGGNILTGGIISATGNIITSTSGNISIGGITSPDSRLVIVGISQPVSYPVTGNSTALGTDIHVTGGDATQTRIVQDTFGTGAYVAFTGRAARGTAASPTQTQSGDTISQFTGRGFSGGSLQFGNSSTGRVDLVAAENFTDTSRATNVTVFTTATGAITPTAIATFSSAAGLSVAGNVAGGNVLTGGLISATGNITGGNVLGGANVNATTHTGTTVSVTGNVTAGNLTVGTGTITVGSIVNANGNAVGNIGSSSNYFNTVFAKATSAQYADLAEKYTADAEYAPGTVVIFGGTAEVTVNAVDGDRKVAGVVSTNPSYTMNSGLESEHVATIALTGRVPCMVVGPVRKGDLMVAAGLGRARAEADPRVGSVIGKALEDFDGAEGTIEVVVGRF